MKMNENDFVKRGYEGRSEGWGVMGRTSMEWINIKMNPGTLTGEGLNVLRGSARTGRVGDASAMATPLGEISVRGQDIEGIYEGNFFLFTSSRCSFWGKH